MKKHLLAILLLPLFILGFSGHTVEAASTIRHDPNGKIISIRSMDGRLALVVDYGHGCRVASLVIDGREVLDSVQGAATGIIYSNRTQTSLSSGPVRIKVHQHTISLEGIEFGEPVRVKETWAFSPTEHSIEWAITRTYEKDGVLDDILLPVWNFRDMTCWTAASLGNGGVAWNKYLDRPLTTYGVHSSAAAFWNRQSRDCLEIAIKDARDWDQRAGDPFSAIRFTHAASGAETVAFSVSEAERGTRHDLRRFTATPDLWAPTPVSTKPVSVRLTLSSPDYDVVIERAKFAGLSSESISALLNTIGRYGVIDEKIVGANGWRSGFACLHEQWFSQIGLALQDPAYLRNCANAYDNYRDHAIQADGRVKSRWWYVAGDAMPGSYDKNGFYEAQWGWLMDSQPAYVMCVAELFDLSGDKAWLRSHKQSCERALDYLLRRDSDSDGLLEMLNESTTQARGSDWIDVIWAAHENALVNAEMFAAMQLWADAEEVLGDATRSKAYRNHAMKLKSSFNRPISQGGFFDPERKYYVYWRDRDASVHGTNFVVPVNFAAIAYGLCDDPSRKKAILDQMENLMTREKLFHWPLCFFPYAPNEGQAINFPFPKYENGDIFLSWGELGIRAYASESPAIALKYVSNVLQQYEKDGLSFQRYERASQNGTGDDILAGNCMTIVGLFRDILGIQPKHNRLLLDPHLAPDLAGTCVNYRLRDVVYQLRWEVGKTSVEARNFNVTAPGLFAVNLGTNLLEFFPKTETVPGMTVKLERPDPLQLEIGKWSSKESDRTWRLRTSAPRVQLKFSGLAAGHRYKLQRGHGKWQDLTADAMGVAEVQIKPGKGRWEEYEMRPGA